MSASEDPTPADQPDPRSADYRPTDEHVRDGDRLAGEMSEVIFQGVCDRAHEVLPRRLGLSPEDPEVTQDEQGADDIYDPECWPIVVVDGRGRRWAVEVEVMVRALPSPQIERAEHDARVAEHAAALARHEAQGRLTDAVLGEMVAQRAERGAAPEGSPAATATSPGRLEPSGVIGMCDECVPAVDQGAADGWCDCGPAEQCAGPCRRRAHAPGSHPPGTVRCRCSADIADDGTALRYWSATCPEHRDDDAARTVGQWSQHPASVAAGWVPPPRAVSDTEALGERGKL